jgi:uncharacterized protein with HEPN domain
MCNRTDLQFFQDILESIDAALEFTSGYDFEQFFTERKTRSATIRELEIIGVNIEVVWDIVQHKLPELKIQLDKIISLENNLDKVDK